MVRDFVEHADFAQGKPAFEQVLLQNANLASVKAVEATDELDGINVGYGRGGHESYDRPVS